ncbi:MAG: hypothetical protein A2X94_03860 [Bdellovibrionales bacterium GWB1_55_8]|nr:MAG: hypothetical protein A2X94_03860 [Bdellovibrionales bacterium GWB1_55_8]
MCKKDFPTSPVPAGTRVALTLRTSDQNSWRSKYERRKKKKVTARGLQSLLWKFPEKIDLRALLQYLQKRK